MRRRDFVIALSSAAVWPLAARAARPPFLVGMIGNSPYWPYFREAMRDLGYTEGQNVKYELRTDETKPARLAEAAKEFASIPVDVIVASGTPASQAAQAATQTIPIVNGCSGRPCSRRVGRKPCTPGQKRNGDLCSRPRYRYQAVAVIERSYSIRDAASPVVQSEQFLQHNFPRRNQNRNARSWYNPCSGRG